MEPIRSSLQELHSLMQELSTQSVLEDDEVYRCPVCRDCGYVLRDGKAYPCACQAEVTLQKKKQAAGLPGRLQHMTFDNFDLRYYPEHLCSEAGASYRTLAEKALYGAKQFVRECIHGHAAQGLFLEGQFGSGKTHLAAAAANALLEADVDVLFLVVPEFLDQLRGSYRREYDGMDETELIRRAYEAPVLILDDLGAHNYTEWVRNKLFAIINHRYNRNLPMIFTTNLTLNEMKENIGSRITSRILEMSRAYCLLVQRDIRIEQSIARSSR